MGHGTERGGHAPVTDIGPTLATGPTFGSAALSCTRMTSRLIDLEVPVEKAFLVAVDTGSEDGWTAQESLSELANLATTAGAEVVGAEWQNRRHVDPNWYIGRQGGGARGRQARDRFDLLITDDELSPAQQRALEDLLRVKVIDRSR